MSAYDWFVVGFMVGNVTGMTLLGIAIKRRMRRGEGR